MATGMATKVTMGFRKRCHMRQSLLSPKLQSVSQPVGDNIYYPEAVKGIRLGKGGREARTSKQAAERPFMPLTTREVLAMGLICLIWSKTFG
jgi:hypothetical protein